MKNLLWIIVAAIVLLGGYMLFTGKSFDELKAMFNGTAATATDAADEATTAATEAAEAAADAATTAVDTATEAAEGAADAVTEAAEGAADAASDAATTAVDTATEAAEGAADAVTEAVEGAADAASDAADTATDAADTATEAADEATDAAAATGQSMNEAMGELLTVEGFDLDKVSEMIAASDLGDVQKTMLTEGLKKAQDNPEMLTGALDAVKKALGM